MNHNEITTIAKVIATTLKDLDVRPNARGWELIIDEVRRQMEPRVVVISKGFKREYVRGSEEMKQAVNILIGNGEPVSIEPV